MSIATRTPEAPAIPSDYIDFAQRFGVRFGPASRWETMPYNLREAKVSEQQAQGIADAYRVSRPRCGETRWLEFKRFTLRADRGGFFVVAYEWR